MAMDQHPNRTPSEHPNPHYRLKWVVNSPTPKWDPIGFDRQPDGSVSPKGYPQNEQILKPTKSFKGQDGMCKWAVFARRGYVEEPGFVWQMHLSQSATACL